MTDVASMAATYDQVSFRMKADEFKQQFHDNYINPMPILKSQKCNGGDPDDKPSEDEDDIEHTDTSDDGLDETISLDHGVSHAVSHVVSPAANSDVDASDSTQDEKRDNYNQ